MSVLVTVTVCLVVYLPLLCVCVIGWVDKAVLFPLMKACFANSMNEREIKTLLASTSLMSLVCFFCGADHCRFIELGRNCGVCVTSECIVRMTVIL